MSPPVRPLVRHGAAAVVLLLRRSRHSSSTFGCHRASIHHPRAQIERRWASIWLPSHKSRVPNHQRPSPTAEQQISAIWPPSASSCAGPQPLPHATVCSSAAVAATSPSLVMVPHLPPPRTRLRRPSSGQMLVAAARPVARLAARCRLHFAGCRLSSASRLHAYLQFCTAWAIFSCRGVLCSAVPQPFFIFLHERGICLVVLIQFWTISAGCCYLLV